MKSRTKPDSAAKELLTLALDIGGTGLKAAVLGPSGDMTTERVRVPTPDAAAPQTVVEALVELVRPLGRFDRVSVGFPGVVRRGLVLTAPHLGTDLWRDFPLAATLAGRFAAPVRVLNDASVQGYGVIAGTGLECVITLGTGIGFALYENGVLGPHLELGRYPVHKRKKLDEFLGRRALRKVGRKRWNRRLHRVIGLLETLVAYDVLYVGGGNAKHITLNLPANVRIVSNAAGITGGIKLWDPRVDYAFVEG